MPPTPTRASRVIYLCLIYLKFRIVCVLLVLLEAFSVAVADEPVILALRSLVRIVGCDPFSIASIGSNLQEI